MPAQTTSRLLTAADEVLLAKRIERGDLSAKEQMIESNVGLVYALAGPYRGRGVPFDDLVQEGVVGLIRAVERFDHRRGRRFSTYAAWWIRHSFMDALDKARPIRIPPAAARQRAQRDLPRVTASLDESISEDGTPLYELIADEDDQPPWQRAAELESRREVWSMLRKLPARHRQVLVRRYGLVGDHVQTHAQIGASLGVGEERSRQLERQALHWLHELGGGLRLAA
jgi:RNA polymerase primary sigma factor